MAKGKRLNPKIENDYKEMFLAALDTFHGIKTVAISYLREKVVIDWDYYANTKWWNEDPVFKMRCELAKPKAIDKVANRAFQKAMEGDSQMLKFILERRGGWTEEIKTDSKVEHIGQVSINIIKPLDI